MLDLMGPETALILVTAAFACIGLWATEVSIGRGDTEYAEHMAALPTLLLAFLLANASTETLTTATDPAFAATTVYNAVFNPE